MDALFERQQINYCQFIKEPQTAEVLAEGRESMEWAMEEKLEGSAMAVQPATALKTATNIMTAT